MQPMSKGKLGDTTSTSRRYGDGCQPESCIVPHGGRSAESDVSGSRNEGRDTFPFPKTTPSALSSSRIRDSASSRASLYSRFAATISFCSWSIRVACLDLAWHTRRSGTAHPGCRVFLLRQRLYQALDVFRPTCDIANEGLYCLWRFCQRHVTLFVMQTDPRSPSSSQSKGTQ